MKKKYFLLILVSVILLSSTAWWLLFMPVNTGGKAFVNVDRDDTADSVLQKISAPHRPTANLRILTTLLDYKKHVRTGHYQIEKNIGNLQLLRRLRGGMQSPVKLTIPLVRTKERLAAELGHRLMLDSAELTEIFTDSAQCARWGTDTANIIGMFIPNTHEIYWNISADKLMARIQKEYNAFWTPQRCELARQSGLSPAEVSTLASIVDEETANNDEKPLIAGMYLNRLAAGMPLQADPTVKFALNDFSLRRIYTKLTLIDHPYNTYRHTGLPPGPIRVASVKGIEAVLHHAQHDFLYMCAKEDFSGTHNFARTYAEHLKNARRYTEALNARDIH